MLPPAFSFKELGCCGLTASQYKLMHHNSKLTSTSMREICNMCCILTSRHMHCGCRNRRCQVLPTQCNRHVAKAKCKWSVIYCQKMLSRQKADAACIMQPLCCTYNSGKAQSKLSGSTVKVTSTIYLQTKSHSSAGASGKPSCSCRGTH